MRSRGTSIGSPATEALAMGRMSRDHATSLIVLTGPSHVRIFAGISVSGLREVYRGRAVIGDTGIDRAADLQ